MKATIIGLGSMGRRRARILQLLGVEVEGIDPNLSVHGVPSVTRVSGEVVFVCTPPDVRDVVLRAEGRPCFVEKPLLIPSDRHLLEKFEGLPIYVSENLWYEPAVYGFLRSIDPGENDYLDLSVSFFYDPRATRLGGIPYLDRIPYSVLLDSHEPNLLCMTLGRPLSVSGYFPNKWEFWGDIFWPRAKASLRLSCHDSGYLRRWQAKGQNTNIRMSIRSPASAQKTYGLEVEDFLSLVQAGVSLRLPTWIEDVFLLHGGMIRSHHEGGREVTLWTDSQEDQP